MSTKYRTRAASIGAALSLLVPFHATAYQAGGEQPASAAATTMEVAGFRITGAGEHPEAGLSPERLQALAAAKLRELGGGTLPAPLRFEQLQQVAESLTLAYRQAGFLVATAVIPVQNVGPDHVVEIRVIEGKVGRVVVQGNQRYRADSLSSPLAALTGHSLRQQDIQSAMLYAHDLPGVSVSSVLMPGQNPGETDIVLIAQEKRPLQVSLAASNHGTDNTGQYRAQIGVDWINPFGLGDVFAASYSQAYDPADSWSGAASYSLPLDLAPGISAIVGYNRSQIDLSTGTFAALELNGPTTQTYAGLDWKFHNTPAWKLQTSLRLIHEKSHLDGLGMRLSEQRFDVIELGLSARHDDPVHRSLDLFQLSLRKALTDGSAEDDWLYPAHESDFAIARLGYLRLQGLGDTQRLLLRLNGQYTEDALTPLEQFALGGPDSVRAFALSEALGDRGFATTLEYQIDAPGFANAASPFGGTWGQALSLQAFYDYGRLFPAGSNRELQAGVTTLQGAGLGLSLHPQQWHGLQLDVSAARPTGSTDPVDGKHTRYWARVGLKF